MVANIQIGLKETTQKELLKQAFEKQLSLPELISEPASLWRLPRPKPHRQAASSLPPHSLRCETP